MKGKQLLPHRWFEDWKNPALLFTLMFSVIGLACYIRYQLLNRFVVYIPPYWPLNIYTPLQITWPEIFGSVAILAGSIIALGYGWNKISRSTLLTIAFGGILISLTNIIHGAKPGIDGPIDGQGPGGGIQYYHDLPAVKHGLLGFIQQYTRLQPSLHTHSQTHPPGPVALIELLLRTYHHTWFVSLFIAGLSILLSVIFLNAILQKYIRADTARRITLLYLAIPAIQIYYMTTIDALVCSLLLGALYAAISQPAWWRLLIGAVCLFAASGLTFLAIFLIPVIVGYALIRRRSYLYIGAITTIVVLGWIIVYQYLGYNYLSSFRIGSAIEAVNAVRTTSGYIATRLDGVGEILLMLGPILIALLFQGLQTRVPTDLRLLSWLGISALILMLAAGVFRNGETGRAALFIFPFLIFGFADLLEKWKLSQKQWLVLFGLIFGQAVFMQLIGSYFW